MLKLHRCFFEHSVSEPLNVSVHGAELILKELDWFAINKYDEWPSFSLFFLFLLVSCVHQRLKPGGWKHGI